MAKFDRFLIAPSNTGFQTDLKPWLIAEDAWEVLKNVYVFRGRVKKRFGSYYMGTGASSAQTQQLLSRLRINLGNTPGAASGNVPGAVYKIGQAFSIGTTILTVISNAAGPQNMLTTNGAITGTFDTGTGAYVIVGAPGATAVYFYPAEPVMGLTNYSPTESINNQSAYAFDTQFAYVFANGWSRSGTSLWHKTLNPTLTGKNLNFFWAINWQGITDDPQVMFVTNYQVKNYNGAGDATDDFIWFFDGTTWTQAQGNPNGFYTGPGAANNPYTGNNIVTARLIVPFKNRLVLLNTVENDGGAAHGTNTNFSNRARFCHYGSPFSVNAWYEPNQTDNAGNVGDGGGYVDAATEEEIISCEFIKDRLIVYFERSTWELAYTGNQVFPFTWQKINTELGSESQFSTVPFDQQVLTVGNTGVHACNGSNVQRIDIKIPDEIFEISNKNTGVQRVVGIRDYLPELVYWTFPSFGENSTAMYPNQILMYNYRNASWALFDDCITMFGYFEQQTALTWADISWTWAEWTSPWNSGVLEPQSRQVIAGNMEGYVFIVDADISRNVGAMQITNLTYPSIGIVQLVLVDHTLAVNDFITIENTSGATITVANPPGIYQVTNIVDANTVQVSDPNLTIAGVYTGGGTSARVSIIDMWSKQWNPYIGSDRNVFIQRIDFGITRTSSGQITVDYYPSSTELSLIKDGGPSGTNALIGNNILETSPYSLLPLEKFQDLLWHPVYFQSDGTMIQIRMYFTPDQMINSLISQDFFELQGLVLYTQPTTSRLQ